MQEKLIPASQQYVETNLALRNLLTGEKQDLRDRWQDKKFLFAFPGMAFYLISPEGRMEFPKEERTEIFRKTLEISLSNNNQKLPAYMFTKKGEIITKNAQGLHTIGSISESKPISNYNGSNTTTPEEGEKTDSYPRTVIASILLIGMSLLDRERLINLVLDSYEKLPRVKRHNLLENFGRLLETDGPSRAYIKDNKLDINNGFEWDAELAYILFFGIYKLAKNGMPQEMKDTMLKSYSLVTLSTLLDYVLDQAEYLKKLKNNTELTGFITYMLTRLANSQGDLPNQEKIKAMQKKLDNLIEAVSYQQSKSPADHGRSLSALSSETAYVRIGRSRPK